MNQFFVGTYTNGQSQGIYSYQLNSDGSLKRLGLAAVAENPSYLTKSQDGRYILAVNEISNEQGIGYISSFSKQGSGLDILSQKPTGGAHPCHVSINSEGFILVANYSGGNVGLLKLKEDGSLTDLLDVQQHQGKGSHERQEGPHAHSAWFTRDDAVISVDLGTNQLWFSKIDRQRNRFIPGDPVSFNLPDGAGPRHLALHPEKPWIYVVNELSSSVSFIEKDPESHNYVLKQTTSTLPKNFSEENTCADIHMSADGQFVYASNRGHNSIAIFGVNPDTGMLRNLGHEPVRGETPRNFTLSPDGQFLLVANQNSDNIVSFIRDQQTGRLKYADQIKAPSPVCLLFR